MKRVFAAAPALALLGLSIASQASITIDTVGVGDPGNAADTSYATPGCGSVSYTYSIGKYEVTAAQYCDFLNKVAKTDTYGLYNTYMDTAVFSYGCNIKRAGGAGSYTYSVASDWADRPVNFVGFWDACRFANWLHNGQPTGSQDASTTERGAYTLDGYNGWDGRSILRNADWRWAVTSEDEWYKAAYYKGGGTNAGYWGFPTQSSIKAPSNQLVDPDPGNSATYYTYGFTIGSPYYRTEVGAHENSGSAYGTYDQGGNVMEWNEAIPRTSGNYAYRGLQGGSYYSYGYYLWATNGVSYLPTDEYDGVGFRVCRVPEPSSVIALAGGLVSLIGIRRRKG